MAELYPEPPHLTIAFYASADEAECFFRICELLQASECSSQGVLEVAPWDRDFELRSDLADVVRRIHADGERLRSLLEGDLSVGRPVRAGFTHRKFGIVVVEYLAAPMQDRHPVGVSLGAGPLGVPPNLWKKADRSKAGRIAEWSKRIMMTGSAACSALYGGIGVEATLATPSALRGGARLLPSEVFVSNAVLASNPNLLQTLRTEFDNNQDASWDHGVFFSAWSPFNDGQITLPGIPSRFRDSSRALGTALSGESST